MLKTSRIASLAILAVVFLLANSPTFSQSSLTAKSTGFQPSVDTVESDRVKDGLVGPVRRVRTEIVKIQTVDNRSVEGKRSILEVVAYDVKGNKIENQYFPVAGATLTGKEVYKYDEKGNISEMTLLNNDGTLLSKETYKYEYDFAGNWNKMTTSVAVIDNGGKFNFEPTEITYRSILYYLDENMVKMAQATPQPKAPAPAASNASTNVAKLNPEPTSSPASDQANKSAAIGQKTVSPSLPPASVAAGKVHVTNSAELQNVSTESTTSEPIEGLSEPPPSPVLNSSAATSKFLKPVSGGVLNGVALSLPAPSYPETAKRMRTSGVVTVEVVIDENGKVISAQATAGPATLREPSVQAALRARFSPTKLSGQPVKVSGVINYKFALSN